MAPAQNWAAIRRLAYAAILQPSAPLTHAAHAGRRSYKIEETLSTLGCSGYESLKKEEQGIYEIDAAKRKMGTLDIKLDKDYTVILISRY